MSYKITLLLDERNLVSGGTVGHAFLKLTDENNNNTYAGFYPYDEEISILWASSGFAKAKIERESEEYHSVTNHRIFDITKKQYDTMLSEIAYIESRTKDKTTTYDLFDGDSGTDDFNCVTFAEHILNTGGINVELGVLPQLALSSSYANEFGETYYNNLSVHAGDGKPGAMVSYTNGYVLYTDGSWDHHTTKPSYSITTSYSNK